MVDDSLADAVHAGWSHVERWVAGWSKVRKFRTMTPEPPSSSRVDGRGGSQ
jgi:hypothetical protein